MSSLTSAPASLSVSPASVCPTFQTSVHNEKYVLHGGPAQVCLYAHARVTETRFHTQHVLSERHGLWCLSTSLHFFETKLASPKAGLVALASPVPAVLGRVTDLQPGDK